MKLSTNIARLATGLAQGLLLFLLFQAPHIDAKIFLPAVLVAGFIPGLIIVNLGNMSFKTLVRWVFAATVIVIGLGAYDAVRRSIYDALHFYGMAQANTFPSFELMFSLCIGLFVGQSLVAASDAEHKLIASYPRYFDVAWKLSVQVIFSGVFVGAFWLILVLGSAMFQLIRIHLFDDIIGNQAFAFPATTMAFAYAIHVTDVRANLVRGIRTLKLNLMSWLLPVIAFFVTAFVLTLPFASIELLWSTHHTSQLLLGAAVCLITLINATYQDGAQEQPPAKFLRYSATLGCVILTPLVGIAIYALVLRVSEYGWTVNIIYVAACLFIAACYAGSYLWAVIKQGPWLHNIEKTNVYIAFVALGLFFILLTPVADPARLSVNNQLSRLRYGLVSADKFDYFYLKEHGGVFGERALAQLRDQPFGPEAKLISQKAAEAIKAENSWEAMHLPPTLQEYAANITVYPTGSALPDSFLSQDWSVYKNRRWTMPQCLFNRLNKCNAYLISQEDPSMPPQILLMDGQVIGTLFRIGDKGWVDVGSLNIPNCSNDIAKSLQAGQFKLVPSTGLDLQVNGKNYEIRRNENCQ